MKQLNYKAAFLALVFYCSFFAIGFANDDEAKKTINKTFPANDNTELFIKNKYGDVEIKSWEKNEIVINVTITIESYSEEKAKELLKYIHVKFTESNNIISAITEIDEGYNRRGWLKFDHNNELQIDYKVNMPNRLALTIENRYGNVYINEHTGKVDLAISYGHLNVNNLTRGNTKPLNNIYLAYSEANIAKSNWLKMEVKYSDVNMDYVKALLLNSRYSNIEVEGSSSVVLDTKYDDYSLGTVNNMVTKSAYSDIKLRKLATKLNLDAKYGDFKIGSVSENFEEISINVMYIDVELGISESASYQLEADVSYGSVDYPETGKLNRIKNSTRLELNGYIGQNPNSSSRVKIYSKYGDIDLD